jgi:hypothetical protein
MGRMRGGGRSGLEGGRRGLRVRVLHMSMEGRVENGRLRVRMLYMYMEVRLRTGG